MRSDQLSRIIVFAVFPCLGLWLFGYLLFERLGAGSHWFGPLPLLTIAVHLYGVTLIAFGVRALVRNSSAVWWVAAGIYSAVALWLLQITVANSISYAYWHTESNGVILLDFYHSAWFYLHEFMGIGTGQLFVSMVGSLLVFATAMYFPVKAFARFITTVRVGNSTWLSAGTIAVIVLLIIGYLSRLPPAEREVARAYVAERGPLLSFYKSTAGRWLLRTKVLRAERLAQPTIDSLVQVGHARTADEVLPNIILITVDALRRDYLTVYGSRFRATPVIDSLLAVTPHTMVAEPFSNSNMSQGGILSIHQSHVFLRPNVKRPGLTDYLSAVGYRTAFFLSGHHSGFGNMDMLYGSAVNHYVQGSGFKRYGITDDRGTVEGLAAHIASGLDPGQPVFHSVHLMSAHIAGKRFLPLPDGIYGAAPPDAGLSDSLHRMEKRYLGGVHQADYLIGKLLDLYRTAGLLDHAILILTADHGESLGEEGRLSHGTAFSKEQYSIPLLIVDTRKLADDTVAIGSQIDIAPTVMDLIGYPAHPAWQGVALTRPHDLYLTGFTSRHDAVDRVLVKSGSSSVIIGKPSNARGDSRVPAFQVTRNDFLLPSMRTSRWPLPVDSAILRRAAAYFQD